MNFLGLSHSNIDAKDSLNLDGLHLDYYPLFFDQDTAKQLFGYLEELPKSFFNPTFKRTKDHKVALCTSDAAWFVDHSVDRSAKDWAYSVCRDHIRGLPAQPLDGKLKDLRNLVQTFTGEKFNAVYVKRLLNGKDYSNWSSQSDPWLGSKYTTPFLTFGSVRNLEFRKRLRYTPPLSGNVAAQKQNQLASMQSVRLLNGSLLIMKDTPGRQTWEHRLAPGDDLCDVSYHIVFRNLKKELIHKQYAKFPLLQYCNQSDDQLMKIWKKHSPREYRIWRKFHPLPKKSSSSDKSRTVSDPLASVVSSAASAVSGFFAEKPPDFKREPVDSSELSESKVISSTSVVQIEPVPSELTLDQLKARIAKKTGEVPPIDILEVQKKKKKTVVVDESHPPLSPDLGGSTTDVDILQKQIITKAFNRLGSIKNADPERFHNEMSKVSEIVKSTNDSNNLKKMEHSIDKLVTGVLNEVLEPLVKNNVISAAEFQRLLVN